MKMRRSKREVFIYYVYSCYKYQNKYERKKNTAKQNIEKGKRNIHNKPKSPNCVYVYVYRM